MDILVLIESFLGPLDTTFGKLFISDFIFICIFWMDSYMDYYFISNRIICYIIY